MKLISISPFIAAALVLALDGEAQVRVPNYGYNKTGQYDTVKAVLLITECDDCPCVAVSGFVTREKMIYYGDPMPPGDYSDRWVVREYLAPNKKHFAKSTIIWNYKLKQ